MIPFRTVVNSFVEIKSRFIDESLEGKIAYGVEYWPKYIIYIYRSKEITISVGRGNLIHDLVEFIKCSDYFYVLYANKLVYML